MEPNRGSWRFRLRSWVAVPYCEIFGFAYVRALGSAPTGSYEIVIYLPGDSSCKLQNPVLFSRMGATDPEGTVFRGGFWTSIPRRSVHAGGFWTRKSESKHRGFIKSTHKCD